MHHIEIVSGSAIRDKVCYIRDSSRMAEYNMDCSGFTQIYTITLAGSLLFPFIKWDSPSVEEYTQVYLHFLQDYDLCNSLFQFS